MAETPKIRQTSVTEEISPDGGVIQSLAAPSAVRPAPVQQSETQVTPEAPATETPIQEGETVTPEVQQEVDKSGEETTSSESVVDFNDFLTTKDGTGDLGLKPKIVPKTTDDTVEPKQETVKPDVNTPAPKPGVIPRDVSDLAPEMAPLFKRMSNEAFNALKPIVLEHKQLKADLAERDQKITNLSKGGLPDNYYENPNGYILDPTYLRTENDANTAQQILNHWQGQFTKIREGGAEIDVLGFNPQGQLVITNKVKADANAEAQVLGIMNAAQQQYFKVATKLESYKESFQTKHEQAKAWLSNWERNSFRGFEGEQGKQAEPQLQSVINELHPSFKSNPLARILAKSILTNVQLGTLLMQQQKNGGVPPKVGANGKPNAATEQQRRAGPTAADTGAASGSNSNNGKKEVSFDDFKAAKEGM